MADGFDELAIENRKTVLEKLLTSSNELKSSLILTSRNTQIDSEYFKKLKRYELLPFGLKQSIQMIQGLFKQKDKKNLSQLQKLLLEKLPEIRSVIPLVPMSLILLVELVNEQKEIPASLTELYERYLEQVLGKWDKDKGIQVLFEYQIKDRFLQELAYQKIFLNNSNEINIQREEFNSFVKDYREKYSTWDDDNKFISEINREGILAINEETVSFRHRSFLDYFIGSYFYNNAEDISNLQEELVKTYFDSQWSDTVFYYIGKKRKISKSFLEKIFKYDQIQYINQSKLIIGRLLQAGWHSEKEIKLFGITESIKFAGKTRSDFKELFVNGQKAESPLQMPELLLDILILVLCEHSFESTFIQNEVLQIIKEKIKTKNFDSYLEIIGLISSINRFLDSSHREMLLTKVIDLFKEGKLFKEDELRYLFLLDIIEKDNKDMKKIIKKRIKKKLKFKEKKPSFLG